MMKGKLLPTAEEMMKKGSGTIHVKIHIITGMIGDKEFEIGFGVGGSIFVTFKGRTVKYSAESLVMDAVETIEGKQT